ncbi:MAG: hypothetical protein ABR555_03540 [Pyrinomonadaceae bacterium]
MSHFHLDHFGDLAPFLFAMRTARHTVSRSKALIIAGGRGLRSLLKTIDDAGNYNLTSQSFAVLIKEVDPESDFELLPGITARAISTPHRPESLALRLTDIDGKKLVYTLDTGFSENLNTFATAVDLLLMGCS